MGRPAEKMAKGDHHLAWRSRTAGRAQPQAGGARPLADGRLTGGDRPWLPVRAGGEIGSAGTTASNRHLPAQMAKLKPVFDRRYGHRDWYETLASHQGRLIGTAVRATTRARAHLATRRLALRAVARRRGGGPRVVSCCRRRSGPCPGHWDARRFQLEGARLIRAARGIRFKFCRILQWDLPQKGGRSTGTSSRSWEGRLRSAIPVGATGRRLVNHLANGDDLAMCSWADNRSAHRVGSHRA